LEGVARQLSTMARSTNQSEIHKDARERKSRDYTQERAEAGGQVRRLDGTTQPTGSPREQSRAVCGTARPEKYVRLPFQGIGQEENWRVSRKMVQEFSQLSTAVGPTFVPASRPRPWRTASHAFTGTLCNKSVESLSTGRAEQSPQTWEWKSEPTKCLRTKHPGMEGDLRQGGHSG